MRESSFGHFGCWADWCRTYGATRGSFLAAVVGDHSGPTVAGGERSGFRLRPRRGRNGRLGRGVTDISKSAIPNASGEVMAIAGIACSRSAREVRELLKRSSEGGSDRGHRHQNTISEIAGSES